MKLLLILLFLAIPFLSIAQSKNDSSKTTVDSSLINPPPSSNDQPVDVSGGAITRTSAAHSFPFLLSLMVLIFGVVVIGLQVYLAAIKVIRSEHIFKCIILTLIIIGSLVLITAGYSNSQINGITGLLGSIAGYLLANMKSGTTKDTKTD